jgi:hypothetical protein
MDPRVKPAGDTYNDEGRISNLDAECESDATAQCPVRAAATSTGSAR